MSGAPVVLFTVKEVMQLLRLSRAKVYLLIEEGIVEGFKLGADWRITRRSVEKMIGPIPSDYFKPQKQEIQRAA